MKTIIMCAVTIDGRIAKKSGEFINWSGSEDKKLFAQETKKAGAVVMGNNTYKTIGQPLKERLNVVLTSTVSDKTSRPGILEYTSRSPKSILAGLLARGFNTVFIIGGAVINSLFLRQRLVDELWLTLIPKVFGEGIGLFEGYDGDVNLEFISCERLASGLIFVKYKVLR